jgi:adenylate cyclase class IV
MKEVEIKIQVTDLAEARKKFEAGGFVFGEPRTQEDTIYIPETEEMVPVKPGVNVLRIRKQDDKVLFTLKQSDQHNHLSKLEHE